MQAPFWPVRRRGLLGADGVCAAALGAIETMAAVSAECHRNGLITLTCGTFGNVLRFLPPLVIVDDLLVDGLEVLEAAYAASN